MSEELNHNENSEEIIENSDEVNETVSQTAQPAEETDTPETADNTANPDFAPVDEAAPAKPVNKKLVLALSYVAVAVVVAVISVFGTLGVQKYNKYNHMGYLDVSGQTLEDLAANARMTVDEFKEEYGLPKDMKRDTLADVASDYRPLGKMAELSGLSLDEAKAQLGLSDNASITADTTWGVALGEVKLSQYVGDDNLAEFKEYYGLGDDVTGDTTWKEVRNTVNQKDYEERIAKENSATPTPSADTSANANTDTTSDTTSDNTADSTTAPSAN